MECFFTRIPATVYEMADGSKVETEVVTASASVDESLLHQDIYLWTQQLRDDLDMLVGFDVEWTLVREEDKIESRASLLKLGCRYGCLLIRLDFKSRSVPSSLRRFLMMKDITFVGVHIKEDLMKLKRDYGLEFRNAVDLSELGVSVLGQPRLGACNLRGLAYEVLSLRVEQRSMRLFWVENWGEDRLTEEQIKCATTEAYLIFRIAEKLMGTGHTNMATSTGDPSIII